jgi:hypothetical protein
MSPESGQAALSVAATLFLIEVILCRQKPHHAKSQK